MDFVLPLIGPLLLIGAILIAGLFLLRAWNNRSESSVAPYNVGRQEARVAMQKNIIRALIVVGVGVILLLGLFVTGLLRPREVMEADVSDPTAVPSELPLDTPEPIMPTDAPVIEEETAVPVPNSPTPLTIEETIENTPTAEITPEPTATSGPDTAVVSSGVGVWLREEPSLEGVQLEWLLEGTELVLLEETAQGETFSWQQVQAPSGTLGWVAADFITIPES